MAKRSRSRSKSRSRSRRRSSRSARRSIRRSPRRSRVVMTPRGPVAVSPRQQSAWQRFKASPSAEMSKQWQKFRASPWAKRAAYGAGVGAVGTAAYLNRERLAKLAKAGYGKAGQGLGYAKGKAGEWWAKRPPYMGGPTPSP